MIMTMLYPNLCYNVTCYKGTALYIYKLAVRARKNYCNNVFVSRINVFLCSNVLGISYIGAQ